MWYNELKQVNDELQDLHKRRAILDEEIEMKTLQLEQITQKIKLKVNDLPPHLILDFYEYLQETPSTNLYDAVGRYINTTKYARNTKKRYKNRLRKYIRLTEHNREKGEI